MWVPPPPPRPAPRPAPLRVKELAAAGAVAVAVDVALFSRHGLAIGGFGLALLFFVVPAALAMAAHARRTSIRLVVITGLLAAVGARCAYDPTTGTVISGLALLVLFTLTLRARRTFLPEAMVSALSAIAKMPSRVGAAVAGVQRIAARTRVGNISILPIVIPLALSVVFAGVFALANPLVAHGLDVAWSAVASVITLPSPLRIFFWAVSLIGAFVLLRPAIRLAKGSEAAVEAGEATPTSLLVARNALGALNVLFLLYNALDAACLWSGATPAGMTTQKYAHAGAFWLTIALIMCTGVVGVMFRGPLSHDVRAKTSRTLAYVWMAQGLVLALGTYRRIGIHIAHSGLSDLRIVGITGTTLVVAGVVAVALKLRRRHTFTWLVRRQLDAFALALVLYAVFPTHLVSARVNVARIEGGEYAPVLHMFRQSQQPESAAALLPLLDHRDVRVRQGVATLLEQAQKNLAADVDSRSSWRERDVASRSTLAKLDAAGPQIAAVLGTVDRHAARHVLLELSRVADEGRSLEELLAVPDADEQSRRDTNVNARTRSDVY
ncbi:MAG: hypothetical protein JWO86_5536 [Myxococcaceae bacterium]|nr:hypothetical protein [Myxococcaceae bacterium]